MKKNLSLVPTERIERMIYFIRGHRVMFDENLALLYGVTTKNLNKAVNRNRDRFPEDFMFQLAQEEWKSLRFQIGTSNKGRGGRRYLPYVFTEHGVVMLANVLKSKRAALISIEVARAFIRLRQALAGQKEVVKEVMELKSFVLRHAQKSDQEFRKVWRAIEKLSMPPPKKEETRMGFKLN